MNRPSRILREFYSCEHHPETAIAFIQSHAARIEARRKTVKTINGIKVRTCFWCDVACRVTRDHVYPSSLGGEDRFENIVPACVVCQQERANLLNAFHIASALRKAYQKERSSSDAIRQFEKFCRNVRKQQRRQERIQDLIAKWIELETTRWGWSPTKTYDFSLPDIPDIDFTPAASP